MKVGQSFIVLYALSKCFGSFNADDISIKQKLGQELFVLEAVGQVWDAILADSHVLKGDYS